MQENRKMKQVAKKLAVVTAKITGFLAFAVVFGFGVGPVIDRGEQIERRTNIKYMQDRFNVLDQNNEDRQSAEYKRLKKDIEACEKEYQSVKKAPSFMPKWYQKYYAKVVGSADKYK